MAQVRLVPNEIRAVQQVLKSGQLRAGRMVAEFETRFAQAVGARFAVAVSSGTAGLHLCVRAAGIAAGDLVITTPFSFVASSNVMLFENAIPVFVDIDPRTGNINPELVADAAKYIEKYLPRRGVDSDVSRHRSIRDQ